MDKITPVIETKLSSLGLELFGLKFIRAGKHSILRIFADKPSGITIADCEQASRELSVLLDVENFSSTSYALEVSSPGIDWPLKHDRDFNRISGHEVTLTVSDTGNERKSISGTVLCCNDGVLRISVQGQERKIQLSTILSGKVELKFR